jgi:hypothetical protein
MADQIINNGLSKVIVSFVYYNSLIRDTLEYTLEKKEYKTEHYQYRKNGIVNEPKINSPLKNFIVNNGEKGEEFLGRINDFIDLLYSDDSTILKEASDGLRVDHAQHVAIFDAICPLHEEIFHIIKLHYDLAKKQNLVEPAITKLLEEDDRFFRATVLSTVSLEIKKQFEEFNKLMNESKGQPTPASNFVQQDLGKLCGHFERSKQYATCKDSLYTDALDAVGNMIDMMRGKRDLPAGKKFPDVFEDVKQKTAIFVTDAQKRWQAIYVPCIQVLIADAQAREAAAPKA